MSAFYNEHDKRTAAWLRELIAEGLIADGVVDDRDIKDIKPDELRSFSQCHFFAGVGGWSCAARLAGLSDDVPVWTGSPPCQPFSTAGQRVGASDDRHLWPVYFRLIAECAPAIVLGEQVAAAIGNGWLDAFFADMESAGYACAAAVLPACSVGAPHNRKRLYFVADTGGAYVERLEQQQHTDAVATKAPHAVDGDKGLHAWLFDQTDPGAFVWPDGLPKPVLACAGFGNAIVPQVAAQFIRAFLDTKTSTL